MKVRLLGAGWVGFQRARSVESAVWKALEGEAVAVVLYNSYESPRNYAAEIDVDGYLKIVELVEVVSVVKAWNHNRLAFVKLHCPSKVGLG